MGRWTGWLFRRVWQERWRTLAETSSADDVESQLTDYITKELVPNQELLPVKRDTKLIESGILDSLSILRLTIFLEEKMGVKVNPDDIVHENFETIDAICRFVQEKKSA